MPRKNGCGNVSFRRLRLLKMQRRDLNLRWPSGLPASGAEDVVDFERLVELIEPFGTVGGAAATAFIERQFELAQQAGDFLACRYMAHARTSAERCLVEVVKRGQ